MLCNGGIYDGKLARKEKKGPRKRERKKKKGPWKRERKQKKKIENEENRRKHGNANDARVSKENLKTKAKPLVTSRGKRGKEKRGET